MVVLVTPLVLTFGILSLVLGWTWLQHLGWGRRARTPGEVAATSPAADQDAADVARPAADETNGSPRWPRTGNGCSEVLREVEEQK